MYDEKVVSLSKSHHCMNIGMIALCEYVCSDKFTIPAIDREQLHFL